MAPFAPAKYRASRIYGLPGIDGVLKWVLSIDRTPSQRELRRPLIVSLARCALGLTRFGTSSGDRAFSREFGEFAEDPCHLSLAGHVLEATLCVPSLEVAMGI